jgi:hypothetical protein
MDGIDKPAHITHFKVQMRIGRVAGSTAGADDLASLFFSQARVCLNGRFLEMWSLRLLRFSEFSRQSCFKKKNVTLKLETIAGFENIQDGEGGFVKGNKARLVLLTIRNTGREFKFTLLPPS